jgi:hypothetical protein
MPLVLGSESLKVPHLGSLIASGSWTAPEIGLESFRPEDRPPFDLANNSLLYWVPVTQIEEANEAFSHGTAVHFCPGAVGGAEWNSPAYDPRTNLILIGEVDWCDTVTPKDVDQLRAVAPDRPGCHETTCHPCTRRPDWPTKGRADSPREFANSRRKWRD